MPPKILLVNPPIYDFSAYDFWLKPYGLLRVAGYLRGQAQLSLFDYLDRFHPLAPSHPAQRQGRGSGGRFMQKTRRSPCSFTAIPRTYRRYGLPRSLFQTMLAEAGPFDVALIQTVMTYWYPGVQEVIADIRAYSPQTTIVLGGVYATLCPQHARRLGLTWCIDRDHFEPALGVVASHPSVAGGSPLGGLCGLACRHIKTRRWLSLQVYLLFGAAGVSRPLRRARSSACWRSSPGSASAGRSISRSMMMPCCSSQTRSCCPSCAKSCSAG
jgi:hypothetical protein